jgi:ATP-dependent Lon protease
MTGELTLTGEVFPVGGIREKLIAARRATLTEIILPADNRGEYEEIPDYLRHNITVHFATHYREVFSHVFSNG